jgi:hypothetical protein
MLFLLQDAPKQEQTSSLLWYINPTTVFYENLPTLKKLNNVPFNLFKKTMVSEEGT